MHGAPFESFLAPWYRALEHELGCVVVLASPDDLRRATNYFYKARQEHADPALDNIMICLPQGGKELFFVRKSVELRDEINAS